MSYVNYQSVGKVEIDQFFFNSSIAGIDFKGQNLTSMDVRF